MHVILISACEKRALKRSRAVLDSYALRSGNRAWLTPITYEGLGELRAMLRRTATRQTSVACFRNDGRAKMKLLWIVGSKKNFDKDGISPVAMQTRRDRSVMPEWAKVCAIIAGCAGLMHDLGKFGIIFQDKLEKAGPVADYVRHEWISLLLARQLIKGASWEEAWKKIAEGGEAKRYKDVDPFNKKLSSARDVLLYLIATHHRLPNEGGNTIGTDNHVRKKCHEPKTNHSPAPVTMQKIEKALERVKDCKGEGDHLYWRAIATASRMALILADHSVSAKKEMHKGAGAYANTCWDENNDRVFNQKLDWHLDEVGKTASDMVFNILSLSPPVLSRDTVERICMPSEGKYAWQNEAARALSVSMEDEKVPHLVMNIAGTGSGKTRMNCRAVCELNETEEVRLATALNLRTLTLQTGDAYADQLGIGKDELTTVIGDRLTAKLHDYHKQDSKPDKKFADDYDDDGNPVVDEFDSIGDFEYYENPKWLEHFTNKKRKLGAIIGSPILVSTIDFLIAAGEPHLQGNHAMAMLRVMTSDLILDEIDGYDPKPLLSVLRLVMMSAMFGKNVVASSATLSRPVAKLLWQAYAKGAQMREQLSGEGAFKTAIIDDQVVPQVGEYEKVDEFMEAYERHLSSLTEKLADGEAYRVPYLQRVETKDRDGWNGALGAAVRLMHGNNSWDDPETNKKLSIGLVRMANIRPAIETAIYLANEFPQARVACYHASHFAIQRSHMEKRLDKLLTRKNGDEHIIEDHQIRQMLDSSTYSELMLIVVASPVEEIGRDHDFDWAVIEPSSSQSIVQTAGRVNRHRLVKIDKPNVAIMQYNLREIDGEKLVFKWPGYEVKEERKYENHDLEKLLDWKSLDKLDARLRFGKHRFAEMDDRSIRDETKKIFQRMTSCDQTEKLWMALDTYTKSRLRDNDGMIRIELTLEEPYDDERSFMAREENSSDAPQHNIKDCVERLPNDWLSKTDEWLLEYSREVFDGNEDDVARSMTVSVTAKHASDVSRHLSFGFYVERHR